MDLESDIQQRPVAPHMREPSDEQLTEALARTEVFFRQLGLPALTLGHDTSYRNKVGWLVLALNLLLLALGIGSLIVDSPRLIQMLLPIQVLTLMAVGLMTRTAKDPYATRARDPDAPRSRLSRRVVASVLVLIAAAVVWFLTPSGSWRDIILFGVAGAAAGPFLLSVAGGAAVLLLHLGRSVLRGLMPSLRYAVREMPLLIPAVLIIFVTDDAWRLFGQLTGWRYVLLLLVFLLIGVVVLHTHIRSAHESLRNMLGTDHRELIKNPQVKTLVVLEPALDEKLSRVEEFNLNAVLVVSAALRLMFIGLATAFALFLFGLLLVDAPATESLLERDGVDAIYRTDFLGSELFLTSELVRLSLVLGSFAALYFAVTVCQAGMREPDKTPDLLENERTALAEALAARPYYLAAHDRLGAHRSDASPPQPVAGPDP
jgi:hypothetical protein